MHPSGQVKRYHVVYTGAVVSDLFFYPFTVDDRIIGDSSSFVLTILDLVQCVLLTCYHLS